MSVERKKLSEAVKELRRVLGMTQAQFAEKLDVGMSTLQRWEQLVPPRGEPLVQLMKLADVHGRGDLAELFQDAISTELGHEVQRFIYGNQVRAAAQQLLPGEAEEVEVLLEILRKPQHASLKSQWQKLRSPLREPIAMSDALFAYFEQFQQELERHIRDGKSDQEIVGAMAQYDPDYVKKFIGPMRMIHRLFEEEAGKEGTK